jgi:Cell division control protein, negative regulator of transcription
METEIYKTEIYKVYYKGLLRVLLVLLRDFPEFLIEASFLLVENVPKRFNQVKNLILSAFPKSMKPPDPFRVSKEQV